MTRKYLIFLTVVGLVGLLFGCHSGGHAPFANVGGGDNAPQRGKVNANGQLESAITFPSGATFNTSEDHTMQENVEVTVTESKTSNIGLNPIGNPQNIYIYTISAVLKTTDALGQTVSTPVYTLDKPLTVTLPTSHLGTNGIAYVGVRLSENEPWRYTRLNENGQITLARKALRASSEKLASQYSFRIFRTNLQIAIFVYNEESGHTESISADSFKATVTEKIAKKDGAYGEDIDVSFSLDGLNLDKINATDITAQVTYKTKSQSPATIKVNGTNCTYVEKGKSDAAVDGTSYYAHTFKVGSLEAGTVMSGQSVYSFKLNLNSVKADDFPTKFLLEVSCNAKTEGLIPFSYAQHMTFTAEGSPDPVIETYTLTLNKGDGIESVTGADSYEAGVEVTASCTMLDGYEFANWSGDFDTESFIMPEKDVTMTANAKPIKYKISYITDGGVFDDGVASPTLYTVKDAFSIPTPTKTYYNFKLWVDSDGAYPDTIDLGTTGDKTLTASYTPKYFAIRYDLAGGSLAEGVTNPASYSIESQKITLNNPSKVGYTFTGWTWEGQTEAVLEATIAQGSTGDRTYTANYALTEYKISYITDGGVFANGVASPTLYTAVSESFTLPTPTKTNYSFVGWVIDDGAPEETVTIANGTHESRTYVASWTLDNVLTFTLAEGVTLDMMRCPAGTFTMGSPESEVGRSSLENQHSVTISKGFYMGTYEVTQAQYMAIMGSNPSAHKTYVPGESEVNLPVEQVSWEDIMLESTGFIAKLNASLKAQLPTGYRFDLPTEAQWEYACRARTKTSFNNDTNIDNESSEDSNLNLVGWYGQNSNRKTHTVGDKTPNAWGLYDMHGNVLEWCKDWYGVYPTTAVTDPAGPESGSFRIFRGGGWDYDPCNCRSAFRNHFIPAFRDNNLGFRLVLVPFE